MNLQQITTLHTLGAIIAIAFGLLALVALCAVLAPKPKRLVPPTLRTSSSRKSSRPRTEAGESSSSGGIGFAGLLTVLFIGLKLTGYITWSWWWVLSPLWISALVAVVVLLVVFLFLAVFDR